MSRPCISGVACVIHRIRMSIRILVVDDEPDFVQLMAYNLSRAGFEVLQATNGLEAVHLARRHVPDQVLLDVMMPGFDGFSVCEVLGRSPATARVPVIMVTALDGVSARARGLEAGAVQQAYQTSRASDIAHYGHGCRQAPPGTVSAGGWLNVPGIFPLLPQWHCANATLRPFTSSIEPTEPFR